MPLWGLPPHTRRRVITDEDYRFQDGTTSAYAEKRLESAYDYRVDRDYLRIRGEEFGVKLISVFR